MSFKLMIYDLALFIDVIGAPLLALFYWRLGQERRQRGGRSMWPRIFGWIFAAIFVTALFDLLADNMPIWWVVFRTVIGPVIIVASIMRDWPLIKKRLICADSLIVQAVRRR